MSLLKKAMEQASSPEDIATSQAVAILSQTSQEAAQCDYFSIDPASGYDAAQIAVRLFEGGFLDDFSDFLRKKNLTPNIVLANGLTLLQNSLMQFPRDTSRLNCLLELGANPNLFMRRVEEKGFGKSTYKASYHPLNYAFANCPQLTTSDVCYALRKYGASTDGIKYHLEVDPETAVADDETKARLRRELVALAPDPDCTSVVRQDVDLSVMQKELANIETQLAAAGFQVVSFVPPKPKPKIKALGPDKIGKTIEDKGIFLGAWEPKDRSGNSLGKTFNVFAAPEDLTDVNGNKVVATFKDAARQVASLRNWHGYNGANLENDTALYDALRNGNYNGEWFIPTRDLLNGSDLDGNKVHSESLYQNRETGDFLKAPFTTSDSAGYANWYWSCTEHRDNSSVVWAVRVLDGASNWIKKDSKSLSCRACRVEISHLTI